jgi:type III pantothenate kinase
VTGPIVVDVGNSRVKWGRCEHGRVVDAVALPPDDPEAWRQQLERWAVPPKCPWVVSGVDPARRDALVAWLHGRAVEVRVLDTYRQLPLVVRVGEPARVGIDRLLNAVAANTRRPPGFAAAVVDAGSAVTVDLVDADGAFRGGTIFPGLRLMAQALHEHTALLPVVAVDRVEPMPGTSTAAAIRAGILRAVLGGVQRIVADFSWQWPDGMSVYVTGGDGPLLLAVQPTLGDAWPAMTLEGILHASSHGTTSVDPSNP